MSTLKASTMYALRSCSKLSLPNTVQENIAKLRIKPAAFKPFHKQIGQRPFRPKQTSDNWREKVLIEYVRRVKEREDPEYSEIFSIFNKVAPSTVEKLSNDAVKYIEKRDEAFRLRVATLLFDRAITEPGFSSVMADCAEKLCCKLEDMREDIQAQVAMFPKLYNIQDTLVFPHSSDANFDNKVIECMKQKEKRRGYAKFMMELYLRDLVSEECVRISLEGVITELKDIAKQPRTCQTEENVGQFAVFLYETAKLAHTKRELTLFLKNELSSILQLEKKSLTSLNMKSRFKIEDAFKLLQ